MNFLLLTCCQLGRIRPTDHLPFGDLAKSCLSDEWPSVQRNMVVRFAADKVLKVQSVCGLNARLLNNKKTAISLKGE
jgi:hypothetical protein